MKTHLNIKKKLISFLKIFLFFLVIISSFNTTSVLAKDSQNHQINKITFSKKYSSLTVRKKITYKVIHLKKGQYVKYSVSNKKLASINKKSGILHAKKEGTVKIKACVYQKNGKKVKILTDSIVIKKAISPIPNATFRVKKELNPWNFTITLKSSRILLKKEVDKSKLTISLKKNKKTKVTASFTKLSKNGKNVTYTILPAKQHILCPGNSSRNGAYRIQSTILPKALTTSYVERINKNTVAGFVLQPNGKPISNALIQIKTTTNTLHCYTNANGFYKINNIKNPTSLTATKKGFEMRTITSLHISKKGTICENIILKSSTNSDYSLDFLITDTLGNPLPNTSVKILSASKSATFNHMTTTTSYLDSFWEKDVLISGITDASGKLSFSNTTNTASNSYTRIQISDKSNFSYEPTYTFHTNNRIQTGKNLNTSNSYYIYISNNATHNLTSISYQTYRVQFSFSELNTNHALMQIQLKKCSNTASCNVSVKCDSTFNSTNCSTLDIILYHKNSHEPFYKASLKNGSFRIVENTLQLPDTLSLSLPNDTYYLRLCAMSENNTPIGLSDICPISVNNNCIQKCEISMQQPYFSRVLTYHRSTDIIDSPSNSSSSQTVTFNLYQILNGSYFLVNTFTTPPFTVSSYDMLTSDFIIPCLLKDSQYLLCPSSSNILTNDYKLFTSKDIILCNSKEEATLSSPALQIACTSSKNENINSTTPSDFTHDFISISFIKSHDILQSTIQTSSSYPNTILAFYKTNGTLLTTSLISANQINSSKNLYTSKMNIILDIYKNKEILITNQDSYKAN